MDKMKLFVVKNCKLGLIKCFKVHEIQNVDTCCKSYFFTVIL